MNASALTHELKLATLQPVQSAQTQSPCKPTAELQSLPPQFPLLKWNREYKRIVHDTPNLSHIYQLPDREIQNSSVITHLTKKMPTKNQ